MEYFILAPYPYLVHPNFPYFFLPFNNHNLGRNVATTSTGYQRQFGFHLLCEPK